MASFNKTIQSKEWKSGMPNIKPAMDEKTTLIASPALVIALKSLYIDFIEIVFDAMFNAKVYLLYKKFCKSSLSKGI